MKLLYLSTLNFNYLYNLNFIYVNKYINNYIILINFFYKYIKKYIYHQKHIKIKSTSKFSNKKIRVQKGLGKARLGSKLNPNIRKGYKSIKTKQKSKIKKVNKLLYKLLFNNNCFKFIFINKKVKRLNNNFLIGNKLNNFYKTILI